MECLKNGVNNGMTEYWKTAAAIKNGSILDINTRNKSYRPSVYFTDCTHFLTQIVGLCFDGYYSRNDYDRLYNDDNVSFVHLSRKIIITSKRMQIILWRSVIEIDWLSVYTSS